MPREKRSVLSAYRRECFELEEEPPELGDTGLLIDIIKECENKTLEYKVENLIWYLMNKLFHTAILFHKVRRRISS